jgi:DNA-binding transcriptional regulator LsrR (DeoR family)
MYLKAVEVMKTYTTEEFTSDALASALGINNYSAGSYIRAAVKRGVIELAKDTNHNELYRYRLVA